MKVDIIQPPIVITLETKEEVGGLYAALHYEISYGDKKEQEFARKLKQALNERLYL